MPVKMFVLKNLGNGGLWNLLMKGLLHLIEADVVSGSGLFIHSVKTQVSYCVISKLCKTINIL